MTANQIAVTLTRDRLEWLHCLVLPRGVTCERRANQESRTSSGLLRPEFIWR